MNTPEQNSPNEVVNEAELEPASHAAAEERNDTAVAVPNDVEVERQIHRMSRRSLIWGAGAIFGVYGFWDWLATRRDDDGIPWPLRRVLEINEQFARDYFRPSRLAPQFPLSAGTTPRANGDIGLSDDFDPEGWKLTLIGAAASKGSGCSDDNTNDSGLQLTLKQIQALPRREMVTELKCIEGWSSVVHWTGARFSDFLSRYPPAASEEEADSGDARPEARARYVSLETPDGGYYVGLDMASALHPQTLLCYAMNGQPLTLAHGAPLRLVIPVKYGIKNLKRIGKITYTNTRPRDYWAEQGYDWYAGH
jgi:hypothetical protein